MRKSSAIDKGLPEIGKIVRALLKEKRMTHRKMALQLGWAPSTITIMLKRKIWTIAELLQIGKALDTDLLKLYYPVPPEPVVPVSQLEAAQKEIETLKAEMKTKDEELFKLRTENAVFREFIRGKAE